MMLKWPEPARRQSPDLSAGTSAKVEAGNQKVLLSISIPEQYYPQV